MRAKGALCYIVYKFISFVWWNVVFQQVRLRREMDKSSGGRIILEACYVLVLRFSKSY